MEDAPADLIARDIELIIDEVRQTGLDKVDDRAFMSLVLQRFAPGECARIPKRSSERRPSATEFYDFFATHPHQGSARIGKLAEARAGEIIAWKDPRGRHGHVALVKRKP